MTRYHKALGVCLVTLFGVWGCAKGPEAASTDKSRSLETKVAKLDEELKSTTAARDQLRKKLGEAETAQAQLQQELDRLRSVAKERDSLAAQLKTRTLERDTVQTKYESFLKDLKDLAGRAEASLHNRPAGTGVATATTGAPAGQ